jgi:hypothetical protein
VATELGRPTSAGGAGIAEEPSRSHSALVGSLSIIVRFRPHVAQNGCAPAGEPQSGQTRTWLIVVSTDAVLLDRLPIVGDVYDELLPVLGDPADVLIAGVVVTVTDPVVSDPVRVE